MEGHFYRCLSLAERPFVYSFHQTPAFARLDTYYKNLATLRLTITEPKRQITETTVPL